VTTRSAEVPTGRLTSLDVFRGITIAGMILVNNPGSWSFVYPPLRHAEWHGWTPTDLIFPFFLFIVGVAMAFSLVARLESGDDRSAIFLKVLKRSLIIIGVGLFLNAFPRFDILDMRYPGVLQRIGIVYFFASVIAMKTDIRGQAVTAGLLLLVYWALMVLVPVPGFGIGDLSPDGNLAAFIDRAVFGSHTWQDRWDPEGLLSTIPAISTTLLGLLTGHLLRSGKERVEIAGWMFVLGWAGILLGLVWNLAFPINKNIWTSSYVIFTAGAALQFLGMCYWLIDIKGWRGWAFPGMVFGMNAIAVYVLSGILVDLLLLIRMRAADGTTTSLYSWFYHHLFVPWAGPLNGSLAFALTYILILFGAMYLLYRRKIFIKI
jgi:predicted acyltransferase